MATHQHNAALSASVASHQPAPASSGGQGPAGTSYARSWRKPATWHLRTRLVLVAMALLITICAAIGISTFASMNSFLTDQLDTQLGQAAERSNDAGRRPQGDDDDSRPNFLNPEVQVVGTLSARIAGGQVTSAGFLAGNATRSPLSSGDRASLLALSPGAGPSDVSLSEGNYRVAAAQLPTGEVLITGLPLAAKENTLSSLVLTMVVYSMVGLLLIGLAGTVLIRRTMKPLEKLSDVATRVSRLPLDAGEVALAVRVPPVDANPGTEVGSVGHALNLMLDNVANALQARQRSETKVRQFVADASHELRTPLTAIRGYTDLMRMTEKFTPDGERSLARVRSQSERMTTLVEDLLLLARLDEGQPLKLGEVDLSQLVVESVSDEKVIARHHLWTLDLPADPVLVRGDAAQLQQVLINLLSNARKHTAPGTTVRSRVRVDGFFAELTVTDDGGGIDPAFVDQAFARFARADPSRKGLGAPAGASGAEGTSGLGLSIVQSIVEAHGGTVSLSSRPGNTVFTLRIPLLADAG